MLPEGIGRIIAAIIVGMIISIAVSGCCEAQSFGLGSPAASAKKKSGSSFGLSGRPPKSLELPATPEPDISKKAVRSDPVASNYRARWTWPGDLRIHLSKPPHSVNPEWLRRATINQLMAMHDYLHDHPPAANT